MGVIEKHLWRNRCEYRKRTIGVVWGFTTYSGFGLMLEPRPLTFMLFSKEKHFIDHDFSISPEPT